MSAARALWRLVPPGPCRQLYFASWALAALAGLAALVPPCVVAVIAAVVFDGADIGLNVMQVVFAGIAAVIARLGLLLLARNTAGSATEYLSQSLRARAARKIGTLPLGAIAQTPVASFETLLLDDVETIGQFASDRLIDIVAAYTMLAGAIGLLAARDWRFGVAAVALMALAGIVRLRRTARTAIDGERERRAREDLAAAVFGAVRNLGLRRSLPAQPTPPAHFRPFSSAERHAADARSEWAATGRLRRRATAAAVAPALVVAVLWLGGAVIDLPTAVLAAALAVRITGALTCALTIAESSAPALESACRFIELFLRAPIVEGSCPLPADTTLRFAGVGFAYPGSDRRAAVLHDVDFSADAGRVTAIVGPSGSGKTTLTRLAARLWDVDCGSVTLGGIDVRTFAADAFMRHVACVFQDVALLDDTVAANLRLARPEAAEADLIAAATAAGAHAFIAALPRGYDTVIGDRGRHLSRGERQRLQIARALLKDAPIVILDEPTASLDPATELEIHAALIPLLAGKTVLVVAHRLSTIVGADRIVVLRDGRVEADGTHAELLGSSPTYVRLWSDYGPPPRAVGAGSGAG